MKTFLKELKFPSTKHTYIKDITNEVNSAIKKAGAKNGFVIVNSKHTTLGIIVNEIAEPNLLQDMLRHVLAHIPRKTNVQQECINNTSTRQPIINTDARITLFAMKLMRIIMQQRI